MRYNSLFVIFISSVFIIGYFKKVEGAEFMDFGPYQGKVVDVDTKGPIEDAVVLVSWYQSHFFAGSTLIDAQETLTDINGEFHLPGIWVFNPWKRLVSDALMNIYKSGYQPIEAGMFKKWKEIDPGVKRYVLELEDGKPVIILKKLTKKERRQCPAPGTSGIPHKKKKLLMQEINKERKYFGLGEVTD